MQKNKLKNATQGGALSSATHSNLDLTMAQALLAQMAAKIAAETAAAASTLKTAAAASTLKQLFACPHTRFLY
jgi:hypothetical protein